MADEVKVESIEMETAEIEATVDSLIESKPADKDADDTEGNQTAEKQSDSHSAGWITSLPKELRDGVDTSKYSSLKEYIEALRSNQKEPPATKEEVEEKWEGLFKEANGENPKDSDTKNLRAIIDALKAEGVDVDEARKVLTIYGNTAQKIVDENKAEADKALATYVDKNWGENRKRYFEDATRGLKAIASESRELLAMAKEQGLTKNPTFVEVCRMLGARTSESAIAKESRGGKKDDYDPKNPLRFKH